MYQYLKGSPLASLLIKAQKSVFSCVIGENNTFFKGLGSDFVELREYTSGDDIKHIDWIISSKMDKPHVKVFHQQKELNIVLVSLVNASLNFGVKKLKLETLNETMALLAYVALKQHDAYESYLYTDTLEVNTQKSKHLFSVRNMVEKVAVNSSLQKDIDYKNLAYSLYKRFSKPSFILLFGDFFNTQELKLDTLAHKHELIVIIIRDRFEENPLALGEINIIDPLSGLSQRVNLDKKASLKIKAKVLKEDELLFNKLHASGVKYLKIYTDEEPLEKLISFMSSL